jgi:2-polyprenyl-3-methyl-5-hydroxy-6-metoxy-1,4-benzoquinol methylase
MTERTAGNGRGAIRPFASATPAAQGRLLAMRLFAAGVAAAELMVMDLGLRLGLYDALAPGPATVAQLAAAAGISARYATEWLEQQTAAGIVKVDDAAAPPGQRKYRLPEGHRQLLTAQGDGSSMIALAVLPLAGIAPLLPRLADAYRTGTGVAFHEYGNAFREIQDKVNRPVFEHQLTPWIGSVMPDVHRRLSQPGALVADVGCGSGWSSVALANAYPEAVVRGFDLDPDTIARARANAGSAGLRGGGRLAFMAKDIAAVASADRYDLICILDSLHDMPRPVEILQACRRLLAPAGCVLLMEPRTAEYFSGPADDVERFLYAVSLLHCLPVGLSDPPSVGTGTVLRPATVRRYAAEAGFRSATVLPAEHRFHRLYRLD